jgi:hypothetical protein
MVTQLTCSACATSIVGTYALSPFFRLSNQSIKFLETFIRNRGNVKEMERETGESYWAIRRRLDEVISEMNFDEAAPQRPGLSRQEILERLSRGEMDVQEAKRLLTEMANPTVP